MYFILANFIHLFHFLKYGLALILGFIGFKMIGSPFFELPSSISLAVVGSLLALSVIASLIFKQEETEKLN
mgnify:CR=1 FL=1